MKKKDIKDAVYDILKESLLKQYKIEVYDYKNIDIKSVISDSGIDLYIDDICNEKDLLHIGHVLNDELIYVLLNFSDEVLRVKHNIDSFLLYKNNHIYTFISKKFLCSESSRCGYIGTVSKDGDHYKITFNDKTKTGHVDFRPKDRIHNTFNEDTYKPRHGRLENEQD